MEREKEKDSVAISLANREDTVDLSQKAEKQSPTSNIKSIIRESNVQYKKKMEEAIVHVIEDGVWHSSFRAGTE